MLNTRVPLSEVLRRGPAILQPGLVIARGDEVLGRVVEMPTGWQLRDHCDISRCLTPPVAAPLEFLRAVAEYENKFTRAPAQGFTSLQGSRKVGSRLPRGGAPTSLSGDTKMAQKDMDDVDAAIHAAKKPGAYNGPGVAPNRGKPPYSGGGAKPVAAKPVAAKPVAAKPVAAKPVAAKPVAAKPAGTGRGRKAELADDTAITLLQASNPKRVGSESHGRYELYRKSKTIGAYLAAGGRRGDLKWDTDHGYIRLGSGA